jgi:1-acyl-sn-glycerol-3-phosphate acyltransferase
VRKEGGEGDDRRFDLLEGGAGLLSALERFQIRFVRKSLDTPAFDGSLRWLQRKIGANWILQGTKNLRTVYGTERLPDFDPKKSFIVVSNHRSFFDLYVTTAYLVKRGLPHRILFPVRANFFYDNPLGFFVNGAMSFFAMYPPVFRDRKRAALNLAGIEEVAWLLRRGGVFVGLHPEGARKKDDDPYTFLPAQSGVGRIIHRAGVQVIPVFIHGLTNDLVKQVSTNVTRTGMPVNVVFGAPVDFGTLLSDTPSPRVYKQVSERALDAIRVLGEEERAIRDAG